MRPVAGSAHSRSFQQPASDGRRRLFEDLRWLVHSRPLATDAFMAVVLLGLCTLWLAWTGTADWQRAAVQLAVIAPLVWRRSFPSAVFGVMAVIGLGQWVLGYRLVGDASLLIALYTVAVHESRARALLASGIMEVGAVLAATRWHPAGTLPRSFLFLTATVVAALFIGLTVRSGSEYMGWLAERAERLEIERDQQASIGAAAERTRIAREMHDIVAHSLSVVVTLADAASIASRSEPERATQAMEQVSAVGRQALTDMRRLIGVLRADAPGAELSPAPTIAQLDALFERVRSTGLAVTVESTGTPFVPGAGLELTVYRIVQEALTNTLKHAGATKASVLLHYARPVLELRVVDNGSRVASRSGNEIGEPGHGIEGMRERARLHDGVVWAGPGELDGWVVSASLVDTAPVLR
ncbi:MAG: sensor histidine kinase [Acidimicrobiales bacterium]